VKRALNAASGPRATRGPAPFVASRWAHLLVLFWACFGASALARRGVAGPLPLPQANVAAPTSYEAALRAFGQALVQLRSGDDSVRDALAIAAEELCISHHRCDAREVAKFFAQLSREARMRGWKAESKLAELRADVFDAGVAGVRGAAWAEQREQLLAELARLIEAEKNAADFAPAAGALSLRALLLTEHAEHADDEAVELAVRARADAELALELFERAGQRTPKLEPLWLLGRLATLDADHATAREQFEACERLARELRRDDFREHALQGGIRLARLEGDARAEEALLAELATFRSPAQSWPVARDWGARLLADDFGQEAAEFLERHAPGEAAHVSDRDEWNLLVGSARLRAGDANLAREHFEEVARSAGGELATLALASLALHEERELETIERLSEPLRDGAFSELGRVRADALLGEALARTNDLDAARTHLARAASAALEWEQRSLSSRSEALESPLARAAGSVIGERLGLHTIALYADVLARSGAALEAVRVIEDSQSRTLRRGASALSSEAIAEWASSFELGLVTWVVGADFTFVAHVAPDGSVSHARVPRGRREVDDAVRRMRELAIASAMETPRRGPSDDASDDASGDEGATRERQGGDERWERRASAFLAEIAPAPIAASLRRAAQANPGAAPRLLLALHGPLEAAPLEALPWDALCGVEDVALVTAAGLPSAEFGPRLDALELEEWILLGGPLDADGRELLPGAREELAAALEARPGATLALGAAFRRTTLLGALRSGAPLHLATHLSNSRADAARSSLGVEHAASFVVTPNDHVTLEDVLRAAPRAPLAVLSTCWSGGGEFVDAEGLFGMARAFLGGGSRNVVVTLWPVEDAAAAQFGAAFHRELKAQGEHPSPARACAAARRQLAREGFDRAGWAAFRAMGRD
jgi:hypothetical protein